MRRERHQIGADHGSRRGQHSCRKHAASGPHDCTTPALTASRSQCAVRDPVGGAATDGGMTEHVPSNLAAWGLHCFSPTARSTPHSVVELDNNGEILAAAVRPVHLNDLAARGIPVTASQVRLLCDYGLLDMDNDLIRTAVPVLGPDVIGPIRERLGDITDRVVDRLAEPVGAVRDELAAAGHGDSAYAVTFGHALDGLLWTELEARGQLPPTELDLEHPYWRGVFWAVFPERASSAGTNLRRRGSSTLVMLWTDDVIHAVQALDQEPGLDEFISAAATGDRIPTSTEFTRADRQLVDDTGRATVPVIEPEGPVQQHCEAIARLTADGLLDSALQPLTESLPGADRSQAVVVVAHELIWTVTDTVVAQGTVDLPPLLSTGAGPLRDLLYLA